MGVLDIDEIHNGDQGVLSYRNEWATLILTTSSNGDQSALSYHNKYATLILVTSSNGDQGALSYHNEWAILILMNPQIAIKAPYHIVMNGRP